MAYPASGPKFVWCAKHNLRNPCPVCADRFVIWELVQAMGGFESFAMQKLAEYDERVPAVLDRVKRGY